MFQYKRLGQFTYQIIRKKKLISPLVAEWLQKEWLHDKKKYPDQPWTVEWLNLLPIIKFRLKMISLQKIVLRKDLMEYSSGTYSFIEQLQNRARDMEESIMQGSSIGPLIVEEKSMELMDGYTRYMVLKKYNEQQVYVYLGSVEE